MNSGRDDRQGTGGSEVFENRRKTGGRNSEAIGLKSGV